MGTSDGIDGGKGDNDSECGVVVSVAVVLSVVAMVSGTVAVLEMVVPVIGMCPPKSHLLRSSEPL